MCASTTHWTNKWKKPVDRAVDRAAENGERLNQFRCSLCSQLGIQGDMHPRERCFIDPKSPLYKPEVHAKKVATARKLGITSPPELLVDDAPGQVNWLISAYMLLGAMGQDEDTTERLVDELIDEK